MLYNCKGVIFDFNGTLFFDSDKHVLAWGRMAEELTKYSELKEAYYRDFCVADNESFHLVAGANYRIRYLVSG